MTATSEFAKFVLGVLSIFVMDIGCGLSSFEATERSRVASDASSTFLDSFWDISGPAHWSLPFSSFATEMSEGSSSTTALSIPSVAGTKDGFSCFKVGLEATSVD